MIELIILNYLAAALGVPCQMERTGSDPPEFVVIEKTGSGPIGPGIFEATLAVQSCGETLLAAAQLNKRVKAAMLDADTLPEVVSCALNSDYNYTDTADKRCRYQAVFYLVHYEE